jgi:hypothetical protein
LNFQFGQLINLLLFFDDFFPNFACYWFRLRMKERSFRLNIIVQVIIFLVFLAEIGRRFRFKIYFFFESIGSNPIKDNNEIYQR